MKSNHSHQRARRTSAKRWPHRLGMALIPLIAFGLVLLQPATAQAQTEVRGKEIPAGLDMFRTVPAKTRFQFREDFTIPAGFFDRESLPFAGTVSFKGVPIGSFREQKTGDTDTVVERKEDAKFYGRRSRVTIPIEVVALSLESDMPIRVQVGKEWQSWNVKLELSPNRKSEGTMTLTRRNEKGGTFNSELVVYALFTFTRQSDGMEKRLDTGEMKLSEQGIKEITLRAIGIPWVQSCSQARSANFCAGVNLAGNLVVVSHNAPRHRHLIILPNRDL